MPTREQVWESRCCKPDKLVWKWAYNFDTIHSHEFLVIGLYYGCEMGIEYFWYDGPFVGLGSSWFYNRTMHFDHKLKVTGECVPRPPPVPSRHFRQYLRVAGGYTTLIGAVTMIATHLLFPVFLYPQADLTWCPWLPLFVLLASLITLYWTGKVGGVLAIMLLILYFFICGPGFVVGLIIALVGAILSIADP